MFSCSTGSSLRKLCSLVQGAPSGALLRQKIHDSYAISAVAGYGKSTYIKNNAKEGDLIVACTRGAVQRLRDMIPNPAIEIQSVERANITQFKSINNLFVDEAN